MEIFRRKPEKTEKNKSSIEEEPEYLKRLKDQVGKEVTVKYIAGSKHLIETGILKKVPSSEYFYLARKANPEHYHLIDMDRTNDQGERYAVRLIEDSEGNAIYENRNVPFIEEQAKDLERSEENS